MARTMCLDFTGVEENSGFRGQGTARSGRLENFGQLGCKRTTWSAVAIFAATLAAMRPLLVGFAIRRCMSSSSWGGCGAPIFALWRLRRVGPQEPVFQRSTVEPANDRLHFVGRGCFDKSEALGFLRFVVSDHFNGIGHEIFGGEPLLNIIGCDPGR